MRDQDRAKPAIRRAHRPGRRWAGLALTFAALVLAGCARRAPGPDECHDVAVRLLLEQQRELLEQRDLLGARLSSADLPDEAVLAQTTECLTTPYDKDLDRCVLSGAAPRACLRAFDARRGVALEETAPEADPWQP